MTATPGDSPPPRKLGAETARGHARRLREGFYAKYLSGEAVLDIGYRGGKADAVPVTENAIGIELDYPGYDGLNLPFGTGSQDAVFASHTLEHIEDWQPTLAEWFRVLKLGGYLVIAVPHQWLYERRAFLPSRFNGDHKRFYTPSVLLNEIETALPVGEWRLRSLRDIDDGFLYERAPELHPIGSYEIEAVIQKIAPPTYADRLRARPQAIVMIKLFAQLLAICVRAENQGNFGDLRSTQDLLRTIPLPSFRSLLPYLPADLHPDEVRPVLKALVATAPFDEEDYLTRYQDVARAVKEGTCLSGLTHYCEHGYFKGRVGNPVPDIFR